MPPSNTPVKAVLFDLDDTLWPIVPAIERAEALMYDWLERHVPAVAREVTIESMRARRQALMETDPIYQIDLRRLRHAVLAEAFHQHGADPALVEHAMEVFSRARNEVQPFDDVVPVLTRLRQRYILGSVSNGVADLKAIGLAHFFHASVAAYQLGCAKPDPEIFLTACRTLDISPEHAVYVGDDPLLDVKGAQRAGLRAVWLDRALHPRRPVPADLQPDAVCADLHALHAWLESR
ncbi:MAG TPA: HAD family hydrolase [Noviherbaspirillum sp.]|nr:HAD family hydrolase [Noviherbaspirillum sp.]